MHNHDANQSDTISVVDLGCGNGTFSLRLAQEIEQDVAENSDSPVGKKTVNIVGIDYAAPSIKLAYHVLNKELKTIIDTKPEFQNNTEEELDIVVNNEELIQEAHVDTIGMGYAVTDHQPDYSILDHSIAKLQFVTYDFVQNSILGMTKLLATKFDIVHDKGTFDAVALSVDQQKLELYKAHAMEIINKDGFFIITSCNFTADELKQQFQDCKCFFNRGKHNHGSLTLFLTLQDFTVFHELEYPTFEFGGSKGSTFCTMYVMIGISFIRINLQNAIIVSSS